MMMLDAVFVNNCVYSFLKMNKIIDDQNYRSPATVFCF